MNSCSEEVTTSKFIKRKTVKINNPSNSKFNNVLKSNNQLQRTVKRCKKQDIKIEREYEQPNEKMIISSEKWQEGFLNHFINQVVKEEIIEPIFNQKNDEEITHHIFIQDNEENNVQEVTIHSFIQHFEQENIIKKIVKLSIFGYIIIGFILIIDYLYKTYFELKPSFWWVKIK